jgi:hypothetical protein
MNIPRSAAGRSIVRTAAIAFAALALVAADAHAQRSGGGAAYVGNGRGGSAYVGHGGGYHGGHGHYGGGSGWVWGGLGLGLGLGLANYYAYPWYAAPSYEVIGPPVVYASPPAVYSAPVPVYSAPVPARRAPAPVIYPRNGQSAATTDADANACSEWAGKQPNATVDDSVFQRGIAACMDARGYTLR